MDILVIGSFMMDQVVLTSRAPKNGETIIGKKFSKHPGGKGANQAVSAARLGGNVMMAGKVGQDENGEIFIDTLKSENIETKAIIKDKDQPTGVGIVVTEENGDNRIIVVPGANSAYSIEELSKIEDSIKKAKIIILQLEIAQVVVDYAVKLAAENKIPVILNPAPARELSDELLKNVDYLTPNETELELLTNKKIKTIEDVQNAAHILLDKGVKNVIVTLASKGALIVNKDITNHVKGFSVKSVDSVAAGDAFNGALAVKLINNHPLDQAVKFANAVGALTVTKEGAISSLPTLKEAEKLIREMD